MEEKPFIEIKGRRNLQDFVLYGVKKGDRFVLEVIEADIENDDEYVKLGLRKINP